MPGEIGPKAFISYSWTSEAHAAWVLDLATQLREYGVDVTIDKWDLKEGHDSLAFMERMVTDPEITKVIVVLDRMYAEKADGRKGGVGTETQIITPDLYKKTDQNKFVGIISEINEDGKPFLPAFYKSRIYIDLSQPDIYAQNFEQLLRWAYDKPLHPKPTIGKKPAFLEDDAILLPTRSRASRASGLFHSGSQNAIGALSEYCDTLVDNLEQFRIAQSPEKQFDELIIKNIDSFLPYRDEFIRLLFSIIKSPISEAGYSVLHRFFEKAARYMWKPASISQWNDHDFDNFKFIIHELFLYSISVALHHEDFASARQLMDERYYVGNISDYSTKPMQPFHIFRQYTESFARRNKRLELRRLSLRADILESRSHNSGIPFRSLMQGDFFLFFREAVDALKEDRRQGWWPETLLYFREYSGPFELLARSESKRYFNKILPVLGLSSQSQLMDVLSKFGETKPLHLPRWEYNTFPIGEALNLDRLAIVEP